MQSSTYSPHMCFTPTCVSSLTWAPIFEVRRRPIWVQQVVLDLLKQLRLLRIISYTLPSIHTLNLDRTRQLRVNFGDLISLCEATVSNYTAVMLRGSSRMLSDINVIRNTFSITAVCSGLRMGARTTRARCGSNSTTYVTGADAGDKD